MGWRDTMRFLYHGRFLDGSSVCCSLLTAPPFHGWTYDEVF